MGSIKIKISNDGAKVDVEVDGVQGASCTDLTKDLLSAVGDILSSDSKPEFFVAEVGNINEST